MNKRLWIALVFAVLTIWPVSADVVIFPFVLEQIDSSNQSTINQLFLDDYESASGTVIRKPDASVICIDKDCAIARAQSMKAEEAVFVSARKLGSKWIVRGSRYKVADKKLLASSQLDSKSIEDFEFAMKRLAAALAGGKTIDAVASIDNITEKEMEESQFRRRQGFYAFGFKFGYLFPMGRLSYEKFDYNYSSYGSSYDTTQYAQVLMTDFVSWFELPKDLALEWDLHVGWGVELGTHFTLLKLLSRGDYAPYAGGGIGMDYVFADTYYEDENKRNSGFALNCKAGMLLFRTYDFRVSVDGGYKIVFNEDLDRGPTANIGITWRKSRSRSSGNPVTTGLAVIGGIVVTAIVIGLVVD